MLTRKQFTKVLTVILTLLMLLPLFSCKKPKEPQNLDMTDLSCEEIIDLVYEKCGTLEFVENLGNSDNSLVTISIKPDGEGVYYGCSYYFGTSIDFIDAAASEPEIQPPAYSFCVAIMPDDTDMEQLAEKVLNKANPQKWVCTGVSTVYTETVGNVLALIMADEETANALKEAFLSLTLKADAPYITTENASGGTTEALVDDGNVNEEALRELHDIIKQIYEAAEGGNAKASYFTETKQDEGFIMTEDSILPSSSKAFFGTTLSYEAAVYSEYNMQPSTYSLCLLKVKDGADIGQIKTAIKDNANPNKWVCVTAEKVVVESNGDYVMLIMASASEADIIRTAFLSLNLK